MLLPVLRVGVVAVIAGLVPCASSAVEPFLLPDLVGTIKHWPDAGIERSASTFSAQATYSRSTLTNREFRRGFIEFVLPELESSDVRRGTLVFADPGDAPNGDLPRNNYRVELYPDADLQLESAAYDRDVIPVGVISVDAI
jgi:hypothetical protein